MSTRKAPSSSTKGTMQFNMAQLDTKDEIVFTTGPLLSDGGPYIKIGIVDLYVMCGELIPEWDGCNRSK